MSERRNIILLALCAIGIGLLAWLSSIEVQLLPAFVPEPASPVVKPTVANLSLSPQNPVEVVKNETQSIVDRVEKRLDETENLLNKAEQGLDIGE